MAARPLTAVLAAFTLTTLAALSAGCSTNDVGTTDTARQEIDLGDPQGVLPPDTGPGLAWERVDHPGFSLGFVVWSGTQFVTVNTRTDGSTELLTSPDGLDWSDAGRTFDDIDVRDLAVSKEALAVWGTVRQSGRNDDPASTIDRIHFSPDNGETWHQRDIRPPDVGPDDPNPGSSIVTAAVRGETVLVSAFFRTISDDGAAVDSSALLRLDLTDPGAGTAAIRDPADPDPADPDPATTEPASPDFAPVDLDPPGIFIGDITVTASGIVMIGADIDGSRLYIEGPTGWSSVDPDTRIATLLSDGRQLYANAWEGYELLRSTDLGTTWRPLNPDVAAFDQTFVGPSGVAGTTAITTTEPWAATPTADGPPVLGTEPLEQGRSETYITWSAAGSQWHHETTTSSFGFPAYAYLAIGDGSVLAVATPLFGERYEEGTIATELYRAELP